MPHTDDKRRSLHPRAKAFGKITGVFNDAVLLLLVVLLFPLIILLLGTPIVLIVRAVTEIARRLL